METAWILFQQLLQMLVYIAIGFVLYRTKLVTRESSKALTHVLLYVILPCVIIHSYQLERTGETMRSVGWSLLLGALVPWRWPWPSSAGSGPSTTSLPASPTPDSWASR